MLCLSILDILSFLVILNVLDLLSFLGSYDPEHLDDLSFGKGNCSTRFGDAQVHEELAAPMRCSTEEHLLVWLGLLATHVIGALGAVHGSRGAIAIFRAATIVCNV